MCGPASLCEAGDETRALCLHSINWATVLALNTWISKTIWSYVCVHLCVWTRVHVPHGTCGCQSSLSTLSASVSPYTSTRWAENFREFFHLCLYTLYRAPGPHSPHWASCGSWGLNQGLQTCKASNLLIESSPKTIVEHNVIQKWPAITVIMRWFLARASCGALETTQNHLMPSNYDLNQAFGGCKSFFPGEEGERKNQWKLNEFILVL